MKEFYYAKEAADYLGITKSNFLFRARSLGITGTGRGYVAQDVLRVGKYKELPQSEKGIKRVNYQKKRNRRSNIVNYEYRDFIKRYAKEHDILSEPISSWENYGKVIYRCKEKDPKSYEDFLKDVIGENTDWKKGPKSLPITAKNEMARRIKVYGSVYNYMDFDPECTFDDELVAKFEELKEERPLYDKRPLREFYKEAMLSLMFKYHFIDTEDYFGYKIVLENEFSELFTSLES